MEETEAADPSTNGMTPRPRAELEPGQMLLGRYRVERVLGQGGMGTVVAARHVELDQLFAFKFLRGDAARRPEVVERFVREARAAASLESAHIGKVHDVGRLDSGEPYMLMEHLTGRDLHRVLDEDGPLTLDDVIRYALEACEAVEEAHARGIVHRDLKPSNLFLHELRSGRLTLKVLDFGISKELSAAGGAQLTSSHALVGTPLYMSPEQVLQPKLVDARSDVWALGVVLYELSTGRAPFLAEAMPEVIGKILQKSPTPPSTARPGLPAWFDAIVMRCLEKAVHERFQSVAELAAAIRRDAGERALAPSAPKGSDRGAVTVLGPLSALREVNPLAVTTCAPVTSSPSPVGGSEPAEAPPTLASSGNAAQSAPAAEGSLADSRGKPRELVEVETRDPPPRSKGSRWIALGAGTLLASVAFYAVRVGAPSVEGRPLSGTDPGHSVAVSANATALPEPSPAVTERVVAAPSPSAEVSAAPLASGDVVRPPSVGTAKKPAASTSVAAPPPAASAPRPPATAEPTLH